MKKKIIFILAFTMMALLLTSCSLEPKPTEPAQKSNLTTGMVKSKIIKGQTTQAEILELFGAPNITTINKSGEEIWSYSKMANNTQSGSTYWTAIFGGSKSAVSNTSSQSLDLTITFDKNNVVKDYTVVQTAY